MGAVLIRAILYKIRVSGIGCIKEAAGPAGQSLRTHFSEIAHVQIPIKERKAVHFFPR